MIDFHTHILPEVDDGSRSFEESLQMIEKEIADGVTDIVITPHMYSKEQLKNRDFHIEQFNKLVEISKDLPINLILGAEIYYHSHIDLDIKNLTLGSSKTILIEFSMMYEMPIEEVAYSLQVSGYQVIIAHVERYPYLETEDYYKIKRTGALLQMNASSILGLDKYANKRVVKYLIKNHLIDIVSSDCHSMDRRPPRLKDAYDKLQRYYKETKELDILFNRKNLISSN